MIGLWHMTEQIEDYKELFAEACSKFSSMSRRREYVCVRLLLRAMTGSGASIRYEESGRPRLTDGRHISISHTRGLCAVIISEEHDVAIDIEVISDRVMKIKDRFLTDEELTGIYRGAGECRSVSLWSPAQSSGGHKGTPLLLWCAKETIYKLFPNDRLSFSDIITQTIESSHLRVLNKKRGVEVTVHYVVLSDVVMTYSMAEPNYP